MARPGPKRKPWPRHPCGRLIEPMREAGYHPSAVKRLVDAAVLGIQDPVWGTPFGRAHLDGKFTATEFSAGKRWDELYRNYCVAIGAPYPHPHSMPIGDVIRSMEPDPDSAAGRAQAKWARRVRRDFEEAHAVLVRQGMLAESSVRALVEGNGSNLPSHLAYLKAKAGLQALAEFWRILDRK